MRSDRPNIILLLTDQQKASATGIYGDRSVRTPAWERAASEGIAFETCLSCSPISVPSRISLMTGVHALVHGATCNRDRAPGGGVATAGSLSRPSPDSEFPIPPCRVAEQDRALPGALPQIAELLQAAGYHTGAVGHCDGHAGLDRGWDHLVDLWAPESELAEVFREVDALSREAQPPRGWASGAHTRPAEECFAARITDLAIDYLDAHADAHARQPFFLQVAHQDPHPPYFPPEPYASMFDPDEIELPPTPDPDRQPRWQIEAAEEMYATHATDRDVRLAMARYYGLIRYADDQINRLLDHLDRRGLLANTWVILSSDHGDYAGEHGLFAKSEALYECLLHVPLVIRPPDGHASAGHRGRRVNGLVQLFDLFPTICEIAGLEVPEHVQARSLLDAVAGAKVPPRDAVYAAVGGNEKPRASFPQGMPRRGVHREIVRMVRTRSEKFIRDPENGDEYYRLDADPDELARVDPAEADNIARILDRWEADCRALRESLKTT